MRTAAKGISIRDMNKYYGTVHALKDFSLDVSPGEFLVLLGPSGCGKSTALRMIAGLESISSGTLMIGDTDATEILPKYRDVAMVFQSYALYPHKTVAENIGFPLKVAKTPKAEMESAIRAAAEQVELEDLLERLPGQLSGGQRQRVALARAIIRRPSVFLMDEPLSNLDAKLRTQTRAQIVKLQRQLNTTTIYVTHDQTEAMTMGDRIAVMNNGQIQQIAPPLEIYEKPANRFVAEFIGSPPMNFLPVDFVPPAKLINHHFTLQLPATWTKALKFSATKSLILGIRPQHLAIGVASESSIQIEVDLVEALGNETYISAHLITQPDTILTGSLPPDQPVKIGDRLWLTLDINKIHLFNGDDGKAIPLIT